MKNCIQIHLKKDEIELRIQEDATHDEVIEALEKKLYELKKLYKEDTTPIFVTGKVLKNTEIDEIQKLIHNCIPVKLNFESPKTLGLHGIKKTYHKPIEISETKYYKGSMRSGQKLEFDGSIVILGDINAGAEVIASENIVVLGILRGLAHAGAKGNKDASIAASLIDTTQLRIANIIKEIEKEDSKGKEIHYAYVQDENIILE